MGARLDSAASVTTGLPRQVVIAETPRKASMLEQSTLFLWCLLRGSQANGDDQFDELLRVYKNPLTVSSRPKILTLGERAIEKGDPLDVVTQSRCLLLIKRGFSRKRARGSSCHTLLGLFDRLGCPQAAEPCHATRTIPLCSLLQQYWFHSAEPPPKTIRYTLFPDSVRGI